MKTLLTACATLVLLSACDSGGPPAKIYEPQRNALDKAKAVDSTVQQAAERQRQAQDEQSK
jgi:ABC-type uncharacterized transport system auxiliary subunit